MEFRIPSGMVWALGLLGGLTAIILPISHGAQRAPQQRVAVPYDWSHHHAKFSIPSSPIKALKVQQEPRYWHQMFRKNPPHEMADMDPEGRSERSSLRFRQKKPNA